MEVVGEIILFANYLLSCNKDKLLLKYTNLHNNMILFVYKDKIINK